MNTYTTTSSRAAGATLGISADKRFFTINGVTTFLYGISYYGAMHITTPQFMLDDLNDMVRDGFNWMRVWAHWDVGGDVSVISQNGAVRQPYIDRLKTLLTECQNRGIIVDVTTTRLNKAPYPSSIAEHLACMRTLAQELKSYRNIYFDVANERNIKDVRYVSLGEVGQLISAIKAIDPERLCTASGLPESASDLNNYFGIGKCDFISPHLDRGQGSSAKTVAAVQNFIKWMEQYRCRAPIHLQEPFRRGFDLRYEPGAEDFLRDGTGAKVAEAAGWCFHTGNNKRVADKRPFRCFIMTDSEGRLYSQLDSVERDVRGRLKEMLGGTEHNVRCYRAKYPEQLAHQIGREEGDAWAAKPGQDREGFLSFGPYLNALPSGNHRVTWRVMIDNTTSDTAEILKIDVNSSGGVLAERTVKRQDFASPNAWQEISLEFSTNGQSQIEFRAYWTARAVVKLESVTLRILAGPAKNQAPRVDAGASQTIILPTNKVTLQGSVSDDGLPTPPGKVTVAWTQQSGPGTVTFADPKAANTTATLPAEGTYTLRLTADDSELTSCDDVTITLLKEGSVQMLKTYQGETDFYHQCGKAISGAWRVTVQDQHHAFFAYGPYDKSLPEGDLSAKFFLRVDNNTYDNAEICTLDVFDATVGETRIARTLRRKDWTQANAYQPFELKFKQIAGHSLEFRIYYIWYSQLDLDKVEIWGAGAGNGNGNGKPDIDDPLTNNKSNKGATFGGRFAPEGFKVTTNIGGYIAYSADILKNIRVEFDAKGYVPAENNAEGKIVLFEIFDSPHDYSWLDERPWNSGPYYMYHFRKRGLYQGKTHVKVDGLELKCGGKGKVEEFKTWEGNTPSGSKAPLSWDPNTTYHWTITIKNGTTEVARNGEMIFSGACADFAPQGKLNVRIGGVPYSPGGNRSGPQNVTYSNVKISQL